MDASVALFAKCPRILIEVEVAPGSESDFVKKYADLTGEDPRTRPNYQRQDNKWGVECRIYFDGPDWVPKNLEFFHCIAEERAGTGYNADFAFRVNSQYLFWKMIKAGYRLGSNMPLAPASSNPATTAAA
jgi:hypothetical protein